MRRQNYYNVNNCKINFRMYCKLLYQKATDKEQQMYCKL